MTPIRNPAENAFPDRLLAEAVRALEQDGAQPLDDPNAEARAREAGGDFEQRIIARAGSLAVSDGLADALRQTRRVIGLILAAGLVLAVVAGAHGEMLVGGDPRPVGAGSIVYIPRRTRHAFTNRSAEPATAYAIYTPPFDGEDRVLLEE